MAKQTGLHSPVPLGSYPTLATLLLLSGFASTAAFFVYESMNSRHTRKLSRELLLGMTSSLLLGFGSFFLLLWTGVYV
ncbi:g4156 [Coccomyxa elongata]